MLEVQRIVTGTIEENCYLITNEEKMLIVDPGNKGAQIIEAIEATGKRPLAILLTHTHYDHIGALEELRKKYELPVYVSPLEQEWLGNPIHNLSGLMRHNDIPDVICQPAEFEFELRNYQIDDFEFEVVATPGHSIGGVSFIFENFVVTGDALFKGSIGRSDLYTGNQAQLLESIQTQLFTLPDELLVYPGHREPTTIGYEKATNPFFN